MEQKIEKIISLAKRRGFIFPASEIYGGFQSTYDYGPFGALMKNNLKNLWLDWALKRKENVFAFDSAILQNPKVWQASGHLSAGFADKLRECKKCHKRFKEDEIKGDICPVCGGELTKAKDFNLMMKTFIGSVENNVNQVYLRPETCQGIFINFLNIKRTTRSKLPFGVAQIGKSFRNEITPKNFIYRTREFEQMELEWFSDPTDKISPDKWFDFWLKERMNFYFKLGIKKENLRKINVPKSKRAHYAKKQIDIEYRFPFGWHEIEGVHNRGDFDLRNHSKYSKENLSYFNDLKKNKVFPYVIETSVGVDRLFLMLLCEFYQEIKGGRTKTTKKTKETEILLKLPKEIAPIKVAVFPLIKKEKKLVKLAKRIFTEIKQEFIAIYDDVDSIGRRYRRVDEIGVPFSITVDFDSLKKNDVTIRDRDTMKQIRVKIKNLSNVIKKALEGEKFISLGKPL